MGKAGRRARSFFDLSWILDPGAEDRRRANQAREEASQQWLNLNDVLPDLQSLDATVHRAGIPNEQRDDYYASSLDAQSDSLGAQRLALQQMQGVANAGGYTDVERGQIRQAQQQAAQYEQSQRLAALQAMQSRGMAGGGGELASRLQAQQGGANRAANSATDVATAAQQRALQAMQSGAQIGSQMGNTGAQMASHRLQRGQAIDAFNRANASARSAAHQQAFDNQAAVYAGLTNQYNTNAGALTDQANQANAQANGLLNTAVGIMT